MGSGWGDSNSRPPAPKAGALTKLRYIPDVAAHATDRHPIVVGVSELDCGGRRRWRWWPSSGGNRQAEFSERCRQLVDVQFAPTIGAVDVGDDGDNVDVRRPEHRAMCVPEAGQAMSQLMRSRRDGHLRRGETDHRATSRCRHRTPRTRRCGVSTRHGHIDERSWPPLPRRDRSHPLDETREIDHVLQVGAVERRQLGRIHRRPIGIHPQPDPRARRPASLARPTSARSAASAPARQPFACAAPGARAFRTRPNDSRANSSTRRLLSTIAIWVVDPRPSVAEATTEASASRRVSASSTPIRSAYPNRNERRNCCVAAGVARRCEATRAAACP